MAIARHKTRQRELREARALLRRVQRGDARAFELLYTTYEGRIYRFCHRLTGREETAAALVELTFARALADLPDQRLDTLDVAAYLHATARALAFERTGEPYGSRGIAEGEVSVANDRLSLQERALLALRDLEGRPDDEIAAALGIEQSSVPGLVGGARLRLLAELRPPGIAGPCAGGLPDLSAYADGTLAAERRAGLEAHATTCADCRATLFALREARLRYQSLPVPEPPGELGSRITRALGLVGLPTRAAAAEPVASGGRQTVVAVAMGALALLGVGVTIAASHDDHDNGRQTPAAPRPGAEPSAPASASQLASGVISVAVARTHRRPPELHHVRTGPRRAARVHKPKPNPALQGLGKSFAPEAPPMAPVAPPAPPKTTVTAPKPERKIPVEIVPPAAPSSAQAASDDSPAQQEGAPPPGPPPPPQTTTT
jgi:DNA-directed RNA polymerase specialized sigma24 family protein/anti-sigma factor RsiW